MSNWYVSKLAAQAEYNWQARYAVMAGRAWIYRHAYYVDDYDYPLAEEFDDTTSVDTQVVYDSDESETL